MSLEIIELQFLNCISLYPNTCYLLGLVEATQLVVFPRCQFHPTVKHLAAEAEQQVHS